MDLEWAEFSLEEWIMKAGAGGVALIPIHLMHTRMTLWWDQHMSYGLSAVCLHMQIFTELSCENWEWEEPLLILTWSPGFQSLHIGERWASACWKSWCLQDGTKLGTSLPGGDREAGRGQASLAIAGLEMATPRCLWGRFLPQALWQTFLTGFARDFYVLKKYQKICLFLFLLMLRARVLG